MRGWRSLIDRPPTVTCSTARSFPSLDRAIEALRLSRSLAQLLSILPEDRREDAWLDIAAGFRDHGSASGLSIPGEQVVLIATT